MKVRTLILDIDGTLLYHPGSLQAIYRGATEVLKGVHEKLAEWEAKGYNIVLLTGRKESMRKFTEEQLRELEIYYDTLVMGCGGGARILINDCKPDGTPTAFAVNVERNKGLQEVTLPNES